MGVSITAGTSPGGGDEGDVVGLTDVVGVTLGVGVGVGVGVSVGVGVGVGVGEAVALGVELAEGDSLGLGHGSASVWASEKGTLRMTPARTLVTAANDIPAALRVLHT